MTSVLREKKTGNARSAANRGVLLGDRASRTQECVSAPSDCMPRTRRQLDTSVTDALARLRSHTYAHDRPLDDIAAEVVARTLGFGDQADGQPG